ncbi:helix-turn-helix domain-containing protein [Nocardioides soli]|uniref:Transcriptional regulator with XRE-family HTH domain n=1 Tax=Nocardioides soli TaxID=1036020 RepID=A0A7W4VTP5_9ACTN|nr:transcriptional regulator with XRE-family HTH domain [Nocardioides soli]
MSWSEYVARWSSGEVNRVIAQKVGVTEPSIARWKNGGIKSPDAKQVAAFARAYGRPILEAFVAADFLTEEEARVRPTAVPSLSSLDEVELIKEILRRAEERGEHGGDTAATSAPALTGLRSAARTTGKVSKNQQRQRNAERAGEPEPDDPDDMEPR